MTVLHADFVKVIAVACFFYNVNYSMVAAKTSQSSKESKSGGSSNHPGPGTGRNGNCWQCSIDSQKYKDKNMQWMNLSHIGGGISDNFFVISKTGPGKSRSDCSGHWSIQCEDSSNVTLLGGRTIHLNITCTRSTEDNGSTTRTECLQFNVNDSIPGQKNPRNCTEHRCTSRWVRDLEDQTMIRCGNALLKKLHNYTDGAWSAIPKTTNTTFCVFWNVSTGNWSEEGCAMKKRNRTHTTCECDHLTSFAILVDTTGQQVVCDVIAIVLHYLFLAVFTWMCVEGVELYVLLVKVFNLKMNRLLYYHLVGYGAPAVVVGISVVIDYFFEFEYKDEGSGTEEEGFFDGYGTNT
uniref:GPS domain-containing protein n=1 Tax=Branchiostoma floridae TaxID=7739 RepID=C3XRG5_BRAFL|eukprot:XP_002613274.1 hypothetical protein BRAFLDRAFT_68239 [Branchiostoma floridae]